ncbi:phospholipase A [Bdellovibrio sp. NC01]|uniref:phospholipase A n=1 Tax=Bdellovibrio sp. NC01 TaxID=2220073 RepID=UPI00115B39F8|nr:phospholipase A [Bdellovibrio sp. NC01]QDK38022.1 hypothetical protein DOE51_10695 [Bdellovibrio sp. NC01]
MKVVCCVVLALILNSPVLLAQTEMAPAEESQRVQEATKQEKKFPTLDEQEKLKILYYKPMYFAYGNPLTKIQLSLRVPLFQEIPINFGYSQMIFWELGEDSKPFLDATYNPEFFYRMKLNESFFNSVDFGIWEHNSNGKGHDDSRSYDTSYVRANFRYDTRRWAWQVMAKGQYLYSIDDTNRDIVDYVSPFMYEIKFLQRFDSWFDHLEVIMNINPGGKWGTDFAKGGYQLSFDFHLGGLKVVPAFYLQYYYGYAETLLNYNERVNEFRAGLMF